MTKTISAQNLSVGWVAALEHLLECGGKDTNVIVVIERIGEEQSTIRQLLDNFIEERNKQTRKELYPVTAVANTLFPQAFYDPRRKTDARSYLYQMYEQSFPIIQRLRANQTGTYFQRLIAWSGKQQQEKQRPVNQLEFVITRLQKNLAKHNTLSSAYEIGVSEVETTDRADDSTEELRIYTPGKDNLIMGFPCLSHVSLTLFKGQLHLTALYRNQHFMRKAYGNYLGLSRLLQFLCQEVQCEAGELVCIASHADAELSLGKRAITNLIQQCKASI